jgi:hypothetical protein
MRVQFLTSFERDLNKVPPQVRRKVVELVLKMEAVRSIRQIDQVKKLRGFKDA